MPSTRLASLRSKVAARTVLPLESSPSPEPVPTTESGITPGNALYDTPPPGSQPVELERSQRSRRSTSRGLAWAESRSRSRSRSERNRRTRARNARRDTSKARGRQPDTRQLAGSSDSDAVRASRDANSTSEEHEQEERHTHPEPEDEADSQTKSTALAFRRKFVEAASRVVGEDVSNRSTQDLEAMLHFVRTCETPSMETSRREASLELLPAAPLGVGGGWHRNHIYGLGSHLKRTSPGFELPVEVHKRQRLTQATDDTATQPETDDEPGEPQRLTQATNDTSTQPETDDEWITPVIPEQRAPTSPNLPANSVTIATQVQTGVPPPPSHTTASHVGTVVPDSQADPQSRRVSPVAGGSPLDSPSQAIAHARLQAKIRAFELERTSGLPRGIRNQLGQIARSSSPAHSGELLPSTIPTAAPDARPISSCPNDPPASPTTLAHLQAELRVFQRERAAEIANLSRSQSDSNLQLNAGSRPSTRTYKGIRSHVGNANDSQTIPTSRTTPRSTVSMPQTSLHSDVGSRTQLSTRSNRQGKARNNGRTSVYSSARARISDLTRNTERSRSRSPVRSGTQRSRAAGRSGSHRRTAPRLDPLAQGRVDGIAYNRRQPSNKSARTVHNQSMLTRQHLDEFLSDNEEDHTRVRATELGIQPTSGRKPKPRACDSTGVARQIITLARLHIYAASLVEGAYLTRGAAMLLASAVHEETWLAELPDIPYQEATPGECAVLVNGLATNRGKSKDRTRPAIQLGYGFRHAITSKDIEFNQELYDSLKDGRFHCLETSPPQGHYENPEIHHCIAASLFHGPNSVGVLYQDYFNDMPLTIAAFVVALMEFCIEEWANGWWESKDLSAANMLEKYEYHLDELTELEKIAPERVGELRKEWFEYAMNYSGTMSRRIKTRRTTRRDEFQPDASPPPIEYYPDGRISARSKGKGRATD